MSRPPVPLIELGRYFQKQLLDTEKRRGCVLWPVNRLNGSGYGQLTIRRKKYGGRRRFLAHRISYALSKGIVPSGMQVIHDCDNRRCVNPEHLTVGTQLENEAGKVKRGRSSRGEKRWSATLTDKEAKRLLALYRSGCRIVDLAKRFNVSYYVAYSISTRKRWKHLV